MAKNDIKELDDTIVERTIEPTIEPIETVEPIKVEKKTCTGACKGRRTWVNGKIVG